MAIIWIFIARLNSQNKFEAVIYGFTTYFFQGICMNEQYYPDPFKFDPNRFLNNDGSLKEKFKIEILKKYRGTRSGPDYQGVTFSLVSNELNPDSKSHFDRIYKGRQCCW